ncbi:transposase [Nostoc sp. 'Peltigera membranacea cyanobiont' 210A]|uniref:transposase n=1 Tax=Nostoc sp. 'Peltigera membranacea cyanobiont' 210A TaxID=2014529 RepID=UPI000B95A1BF|nr:transposase [Nostoc sp. 'Peltigera membranacea cyanobiont' 210A]OYD96811.1 transposase [Nostoc sp. 'Peltigera membranacea cyanobiont' 210A]
MTEQVTDYDSPWKEVIELYFPRFLEFFFTQAYAEIDWTRPYEFLDTELQQLEPDAEIGRRLVDKVAKVWLLDGEEAWVLVHVEVQGQYDSQFAERMYTYNYRLFDRHKSLEFPVAKLLDYEQGWETLEQTTNPFGVIVMAHLKTKATQRNPENRLQWKLSLVRRLYERGYSREDIRELFRFIDWIMVLPKELALSFKTEVRSYEEADRMRYVTSIERLAKEEGIVENARESIITVLETRFGEVPSSIVEVINEIEEPSVLKMLFKSAIAIPSTAEFQQVLDNLNSGKCV